MLEGLIRKLIPASAQLDKDMKEEKQQVEVVSGPRLRLQETRDQLKIDFAQVELAEYLRQVEGDESVVIPAKVRNLLRHNGKPYLGSRYRGVCRNASRFQVSKRSESRYSSW